jgi:hypothetical protein
MVERLTRRTPPKASIESAELARILLDSTAEAINVRRWQGVQASKSQ